jgi:hypothetical protein
VSPRRLTRIDVTEEAPSLPLEDLLELGAELKGELIKFVQGPRYAKQLDRLMIEEAEFYGSLDEATMITIIDEFMLPSWTREDPTVLDAFIANRRPPLSAVERELLLSWKDVVEGYFEVRSRSKATIVVHNLVDDLVYRVHASGGADAFKPIRKGMFVAGRIVPVHPALEDRQVSGYLRTLPKSQGPELAQVALQLVADRPEVVMRNPELARRSWETQAKARARFIADFGSDLVILPPAEAVARLRAYLLRTPSKRGPKSPELIGMADALIKELADLLDSETIAIVYDELEGLCFFAEFGRLDDLFADPALAKDRTYLTTLRDYLKDDSVSPSAIRRLVERHPEGVDEVFRTLLRKPKFSWAADGEKLLRSRKPEFFEQEPIPSMTTLGDRLLELLAVER